MGKTWMPSPGTYVRHTATTQHPIRVGDVGDGVFYEPVGTTAMAQFEDLSDPELFFRKKHLTPKMVDTRLQPMQG